MSQDIALRGLSVLGLVVFIGIAWLLSENRQRFPWRVVLWGLGLQFGIGFLLLPTFIQTYVFSPILHGVVRVLTLGMVRMESTPDELFFSAMQTCVDLLTRATIAGAGFVFGRLSDDMSYGATMAFQALPVIILVSSLSAVFYHLGLIQKIVRFMAWLMRRTTGTSGAETFGAALLVFFGIEATTALRAYLRDMTRSEICTVLTAFMSTIASSVMVVYASFGASPGHLLAASLMSAPAAILISKLMTPETGKPITAGHAVEVSLPVESRNVIDAASRGASDGMNLVLHVGAMLIAFIGIMYLLNAVLEGVSHLVLPWTWAPIAGKMGWSVPESLSFKGIMSVFFMPFAFLMGVPWQDIHSVSSLLGTKTVFNEFLAYIDLKAVRETLTPRGAMIATYALCGFANPGSLGIVIAGMTGLAPERRQDIVGLGAKAFIGGTLACFMTACVAGIMARV